MKSTAYLEEKTPVVPAKAGIQLTSSGGIDSRLRGNDNKGDLK